MRKLCSFLVHQVKQLFSEFLRVVNQVDWHEVCPLSNNLLFSKSSSGPSLFFFKFFFFVFGMSSDSFFPLDFRGIAHIIVLVTGFDGVKSLSSGDEEIAGNDSDFGGGVEASVSDDVNSTIVSPDVSSVEFDHELNGLLGSFVAVFCDILRNEFFKFLVDFIVLMMLVHSSHIVEDVLVKNFPQLLIFDVKLLQQKLYRADWIQNVLGPQNHYH